MPCGAVTRRRSCRVRGRRRSRVLSGRNEHLIAAAASARPRRHAPCSIDAAVAVLHTRRLRPEVEADSLRLEDRRAARVATSGSSRGRNVDRHRPPPPRCRAARTPARARDRRRRPRRRAAVAAARATRTRVSFVRYGTPSRPSIAGMAGRLPVHTTTCSRAEALVADLQRARVDEPRASAAHHDAVASRCAASS